MLQGEPLCLLVGMQSTEEEASVGLGLRDETGPEGWAELRGMARSTQRWSEAWAQYLEGWLRDETVKITHGRGDVHRHGPLFLRWRFGRLQGGYNCGSFLEKSGRGDRGRGRELLPVTHAPEVSPCHPQSQPGHQSPFLLASTTSKYQPSTLDPPSCLLGPGKYWRGRLKQHPL